MSKEDWFQYYTERIQEEAGGDLAKYHFLKLERRQAILDRIRKYATAHGRLLEAGSGTGTLSIALSKEGYKCTAIDIDERMLAVLEKISKVVGGSVEILKADILQSPFSKDSFDLAFNHGVFEHEEDETIVTMIEKLLYVAPILIFGVPSEYYKGPQLGNERLLPHTYWEKIISKTPAALLEKFGSEKEYQKAEHIGFVLRRF